MFDSAEYSRLSGHAQEVVTKVAEYLGSKVEEHPLATWDDEDFEEVFDLVQECAGSVPDGYTDELESSIRDKFACVLYTAMTRAEQTLKEHANYHASLDLLVDVSIDDRSKLAVLDTERKQVLYYDTAKAWAWYFESLEALADYVWQVQEAITSQALASEAQ